MAQERGKVNALFGALLAGHGGNKKCSTEIVKRQFQEQFQPWPFNYLHQQNSAANVFAGRAWTVAKIDP